MWYPEIDTGWNRGISAWQNSMTSVTRRTEGLGGKTYSFWAWYSFSMSFCRVPPSLDLPTPDLAAAATYIARRMGAGELIVMDVVTVPRSIPANRSSTSAR